MLEREVKLLLIDVLHLEDVAPDDIDPDVPLFGDGLGLDSIDALEIAAALHQRYGITLPADPQALRAHLSSVRALAALIATERGQRPG